ncbi:MAG: hypothetical protein P8Y70_06450 [Candidatus Lokiarchaeota archaeon]
MPDNAVIPYGEIKFFSDAPARDRFEISIQRDCEIIEEGRKEKDQVKTRGGFLLLKNDLEEYCNLFKRLELRP